jgi:hypothetical protein
MGYKYMPVTRELERELWIEISQQIYYGDADPTRALPLPYEELPVSLSHSPANAEIKLLYGFSRPAKGRDDLDFHCPISNEDSQKRTAEGVILRVHPPAGFEYVWDSARVLKNAVESVPKLSKRTQFEFGRLQIGLDYAWFPPSPPGGAEVIPKLSKRLEFELGHLATGEEILFKCSFMPFPPK